MKLFASIHTREPETQSQYEANYPGYQRIPIECEIGADFFHVFFPVVPEDTAAVMTHMTIGTSESGDGDIFMTFYCEPHVQIRQMAEGKRPHVIVLYPENLPMASRVVHQLCITGRIRAEELTPPVFERVNQDLHAHGIPVLKAVRKASAKWEGTVSMMPSLNEIAPAGNA